ncbi:MAG: ferritin-like domain-containing protein [Byssovorax sp.]
MDDVGRHRAQLLARILQITASGSLGLALLSTAQCGARSSLRISGGAGGHGGAGGAGGSDVTTSVSASTTDGAGGFLSFDGGATTSGGVTDGGTEIVLACFSGETLPGCPDAADAVTTIMGVISPCATFVAVVSGPTLQGTLCCYEVEVMPFPCYVGRTFFLDDGVVKASLRKGGRWRAGSAPSVAGMPERTRSALAEAWARDGLFEHASVASFSRFTMQLLALGAPADLVRDTQLANVDEVQHAELCLGLASAYFGEPVEPTALPFPAAILIEPDLASIAAEAAMEACIGETVATVQAMEALANTTDPAVREVLRATVDDEARHAELGWRFLAWAIDTGGEATRQAVIRSFASFCPPAPTAEDLDGVDLAIYAAHGRQRASEGRAIAARVLREIVQPAVCALLARGAAREQREDRR